MERRRCGHRCLDRRMNYIHPIIRNKMNFFNRGLTRIIKHVRIVQRNFIQFLYNTFLRPIRLRIFDHQHHLPSRSRTYPRCSVNAIFLPKLPSRNSRGPPRPVFTCCPNTPQKILTIQLIVSCCFCCLPRAANASCHKSWFDLFSSLSSEEIVALCRLIAVIPLAIEWISRI